jgi:hypothetical protein
MALNLTISIYLFQHTRLSALSKEGVTLFLPLWIALHTLSRLREEKAC